jgi:hypothetical protein
MKQLLWMGETMFQVLNIKKTIHLVLVLKKKNFIYEGQKRCIQTKTNFCFFSNSMQISLYLLHCL